MAPLPLPTIQVSDLFRTFIDWEMKHVPQGKSANTSGSTLYSIVEGLMKAYG